MDSESEYVKTTVGPALALGLAEVALTRPKDPIEYLGLWLLKHKKNLKDREMHENQELDISPERSPMPQDTSTAVVEEEPPPPEEHPLAPPTEDLVLPSSRPGSKLSRIEEEFEQEES